MCKSLKIKKPQTTAFHPESECVLERSHRVLKEYMKRYTGEDQRNWGNCIPCATLDCNIIEHLSTWTLPIQNTVSIKYQIITRSPKYNLQYFNKMYTHRRLTQLYIYLSLATGFGLPDHLQACVLCTKSIYNW